MHFYDWMVNPSWGYDPMRKNTSYWGITDKLTVVAELPAEKKRILVEYVMVLLRRSATT